MSKPRVLHIYKDYWPPVMGGAEKTINLMCRVTRDEYDPSVLVSNRAPRDEVTTEDGIQVTKVATYGRYLSAPVTPGLAGWIRRTPADIIHVHLPNPTAVLALLRAKPTAPIVVTWHSDIVRQAWALAVYKPFLYRFLSGVAAIMPTSPDYAAQSPHLQRFPEKLRIVPLAIDVAAMQPTPTERIEIERLRAAKVRPAVVFVGRLRYYKGLQFLIEAMRGIDADTWIVGTGPEETRLRAQTALSGIENKIHFLGDLNDSDLKVRLHAADIYCLPAHLRSEAFGLNQIEGMAAGLPVVSTNVGGVAYVNQHNETGLVVPPGDSVALRLAIETLIQNPEAGRTFGENAKKRAYVEFDLPALAKRLKAVYAAVLG